jgi:hypothetical protein
MAARILVAAEVGSSVMSGESTIHANRRQLLLGFCLMSGCAAPTPPLALDPARINGSLGRVGLIFGLPSKPSTYFQGVDGLVGIAFVEGVHATLTAHAETLPTGALLPLKSEIMGLLRKKGVAVVELEGVKVSDLPRAPSGEGRQTGKDFRLLRERFKIDRVMVINVGFLGFTRKYEGRAPKTDPLAYISGAGYLVNLENNQLEWYESVGHERAASAKWDEPPSYPNLTKAYAEVVEVAKDQFRRPFLQP